MPVTVDIPVTSGNPRTATIAGLEGAINEALAELSTQIDFGNFGLNFSGEADLVSGFPSGASEGDFYITSEGTVDDQEFNSGDVIVALIDAPSTFAYDANWKRIPFAVIPRQPFVVTASGQSNYDILRDTTWVPPANFKVWDNNLGIGGVGTGYVDPEINKIGAAEAFCGSIARKYPMLDVRLVRVASPSMSIDHWTGGLKYTWKPESVGTLPEAGEVNINTGNDAIPTIFRMHKFDSAGVNRSEAITKANLAFCEFIRVELASDNTVSATYTPNIGTMTEDNDVYTFNLTDQTATATDAFAADVDVRVIIGPDVRADLEANIPPALAAAGVLAPDVALWWQGEANLLHPDTYVADFQEMWDDWVQKGYVSAQTPLLIHGIGDERILPGNIRATEFNVVQQQVANAGPSHRMYVNTSVLDRILWNGNHMTDNGYYAAGELAANQFLYGSRYGSPIAAQDTISGQLYFGPGSEADPSLGFANGGGDNTGFYRHAERVWGFTASLFARAKTGFAAAHSFLADNQLTVTMGRAGNNANPPQLFMEKSRGTQEAPLIVEDGDSPMQIIGRVHDGTEMQAVATLQAVVSEPTPTSSALGARWSVKCAPQGTASTVEILGLSHEDGLSVRGTAVITPERLVVPDDFTVSNLPTDVALGSRATVTDATATTFGTVVSGGGANIVPVYYDGTDWRVG